MTAEFLPRGLGDIQTAVVNLVARLAPVVPMVEQPSLARRVAEIIAGMTSSMGRDMFVRQSIIRCGTATTEQTVDGLAAWVTVVFDLANLQRDRRAALDVPVAIADQALTRLADATARARHGCILAVPHTGSIELFCALLKDHGFDMGFVYSIGDDPSPTERWIRAGRSATHAAAIAFARRDTGDGIAKILRRGGVVLMVVDVYPSDRFKGIPVVIGGATFRYPPGPARYARTGTLVLPGFASIRTAEGFAMNILDPIEMASGGAVSAAASSFTQRLADRIGAFTAAHPESFWLWHPIPQDPYIAIARHHRPDLLGAMVAAPADDEPVALAIDALAADLGAR